MSSYFIFAATYAALIGISSAGLQVPLVIVNFSPYDASVDMSLDENCIKHDFNPVDLNHYYKSWESNDLGNFGDGDYAPFNDYLQEYKTQFGLPKLQDNRTFMSNITTIPAFTFDENSIPTSAPHMVFETEMDGSGECFGSRSSKSFNITVNGKTQSFTLEDPPTSEWTLTMTEPSNTRIVLGSGGHAKWGLVTGETLTAIGASLVVSRVYSLYLRTRFVYNLMDLGITRLIGPSPATFVKALPPVFGTGVLGVIDYVLKHANEKAAEDTTQSIDKNALYAQFTDVYDTVEDDTRSACILGQNIIGNYDCLVAGVSLIIQENGDALAVPLPNIYRAWN